MPEALQRQIGPFKLWQWLLIVVAGIGVGLLIRSQLAGRTTTTPAVKGRGQTPQGLPATQGAPTIIQEDSQAVRDIAAEQQRLQKDFGTITTLQKEQDRFADELEFRDSRQSEFFADIRERIAAINVPTEPKTASSLEQARQQFREFFGIEPSANESAAKLLRRIRQGGKDRNLAQARKEFRQTFGIEPSMNESAAKLRRRIGDAGKNIQNGSVTFEQHGTISSL